MAGYKWPRQLPLWLGIDRHADAKSPNFATALLDLPPTSVEVVAILPIRPPPRAKFEVAAFRIIVARTGRAREVEIVLQNPPQHMGARVALFNMMKEMRFRPIVRDGKAVIAEAVIRDYRYEY